MYTNLGAKLKTIAKVVFWALTAAAEICCVLMLARVLPGAWYSLDVAGTLLVMALAPAVVWLLTVPLYAFGHLIENSDIRTDLAVRTAAAQGLIARDSVVSGETQTRVERRAPQAYAGAAPQPYVRPAQAPYAQPYGAAPQSRPQPYPQQPYAPARPMPPQAPQARPAAPAPQPQPAAPVRPAAPAPKPQVQPETEAKAAEIPERVPYVTPPPAPWDKPKEETQENNE